MASLSLKTRKEVLSLHSPFYILAESVQQSILSKECVKLKMVPKVVIPADCVRGHAGSPYTTSAHPTSIGSLPIILLFVSIPISFSHCTISHFNYYFIVRF